MTAQETRTPPPFAGGDAIPHTGAVDVRADRRAAVAKRRAAAGNLVGHGGPVKAVAADATLAFVASGSFDYSLMVWDVRGERPRLVRRHTVFAGAVNAVRFVPGSDRLVAGGDDGQLWLLGRDAAAPVARLEGHKAKINALAVTSDGRFAASAGWDHTARIWDLGGLRAGPVLEGHRGPVNAVEFSGDGATVYTGGTDGRVLAWRRSDGTQLRTVHKHGWGINVLRRVAAAGCDCLIAGTSNGAVLVLDPQAGTIVAELAAHARPVLAVAVLARPGLVATGGGGGVLNVTRIGDWKPIATYQNTFGPVWALAFVEDGKALYYGGLDDFVARWQLSPRAPFEHADSPFPRRFQMGEGLSSGERQFARKCSVCHTLGPDDGNRAGPTLYRIFGRKAGTLPGYPFSEALKRAGFAWDEGTIGQLFAQGPDVFTPGSKMPLQRITDAVMRDALIRFLKSATAEGRGGAAAPEGAQPDPQAKGEKSR
ncbi:MAG: cytochrome C [Hyphomicrobiaceae bacterium]